MQCTSEYCIDVHCLEQENFPMEFRNESGLQKCVGLSVLCWGLKVRTLAQRGADCQTKLGHSGSPLGFTLEFGSSD